MPSHSFAFDPTYGYDLPALRRVPAADEPADFATFWRETFLQAQAIAPQLQLIPSEKRVEGFNVFDVAFNSLDEVRIRGWVTLPQSRPARRALVVSHGYGGRDGPDELPLLEDAATIFPCARGISASHHPQIPADPARHVLHGIERRETYVLRGCAADVWAAASVLGAVAPAALARLDYVGSSFGGGVGALALPWDKRFTSAFLAVPSFGQYSFRLRVPCLGSGESVRHYAVNHPGVERMLAYYDASIAAKYLGIPVLVAAAAFDPFVPPPGQFAVFNALPGPKRLVVLETGHFDWPGAPEVEAHSRRALLSFLAEPLP